MQSSPPETAPFQVVARLQPVPPHTRSTWHPGSDPRVLILAREPPGDPLATHTFPLDRVLGPMVSQATFYAKCVHPLVSAVVQGVHAVVFCYGPARSGRHYTLEGRGGDDAEGSEEGIIPRAVASLLTYAAEVEREIAVHLAATYVWVTPTEGLVDLAASSSTTRETTTVLGVSVTLFPLKRPQDIWPVIAGAHTAPVGQPGVEGRGHTVLTLRLTQEQGAAKLAARLHFVNLSPAERGHEFGREDLIRSQRALAALSSVIAHVHKGSAHVPYRDARLTSLLRDSLTRNSLGLFICTLHPIPDRFTEALRAAKYARRIKQLCTPPPGPFVGRFDQASRHLVTGRQSPAPEADGRAPLPHPVPVPHQHQHPSPQRTTQPPPAPAAPSPPPHPTPLPRSTSPTRSDGTAAMLADPRPSASHPTPVPCPSPLLDDSGEGSEQPPAPRGYPVAGKAPETVMAHLELEDASCGLPEPPLAPSTAPPDTPPTKAMPLAADHHGVMAQVEAWRREACGSAPRPFDSPEGRTKEVEILKRALLEREAETQAWRGEQDRLRTELIAARGALLESRAKKDGYFRELEPLRSKWRQEADQRRLAELEAEHWRKEFARIEGEQAEMRHTVVAAKHQLSRLSDQLQELQVSHKAATAALEAKAGERAGLEEQLREAREQAGRLQGRMVDLHRQLVELPPPHISTTLPSDDLGLPLPGSPSTFSQRDILTLERHLRSTVEERDALRRDLAERREPWDTDAATRALQLHYGAVLAERHLLAQALQACRREVLGLLQEREVLRKEMVLTRDVPPLASMSASRVQQALCDYHHLERELAVKTVQLQEKHEELQLLHLQNGALQLAAQQSGVGPPVVPAPPTAHLPPQLSVPLLDATTNTIAPNTTLTPPRPDRVALLERQLEMEILARQRAEARLQSQQHLLLHAEESQRTEGGRGSSSGSGDWRGRWGRDTGGWTDPSYNCTRDGEQANSPDVRSLVLRAAHLHETLQAMARMAGLPFPSTEADPEACRELRRAFGEWLMTRLTAGAP